jgi:hypothetical protein
MNADEALDQIDRLLQAQAAPLLNPKRAIFRGAWDDLTYPKMMLEWRREYDLSYIKAQGAQLCRQLTQLLGVSVKKRTFQEDVLEGLAQRSRQAPTYLPLTSLTTPFTSNIQALPQRQFDGKGFVIPSNQANVLCPNVFNETCCACWLKKQ